MTVAIQLDAETERLARKLAEVTGKPLPAVVKEAIEARAEAVGLPLEARERRMSRDELLERMKEIVKGFDSLPVLDSRSPDEIIGYDEFGVPR